MSDRQRFSLWVAILITSISIPAPAAQTAEVMTPVPPGAMLAAFDVDQGTPDAACVARCATTRDRETTAADAMLKDRRYYSNFDSNCWTLTGGPNCAATRQTCREACAPKYDNACMNACEAPFQSCCAANDRTRAARDYDACVVKCPGSKVVQPPPPPPPPPPAPPVDRKTAWTSLLKAANAALDAVAPSLESLDLDRFNNLRRSLAFMQVSAVLAQHNGRFAMVSGGNGRIWIIKPTGEPVQLPAATALAMRNPPILREGNVDFSDAEKARLAAYDASVSKGLASAGLSAEEAGTIMNNIAVYGKFSTPTGFKPGDVWYFPPDGGWSKEAIAGMPMASSEHSSVRGTINGGGDFI